MYVLEGLAIVNGSQEGDKDYEDKLEKARKCFTKAYIDANSNDQKATAAHHMARMSAKLAKARRNQSSTAENTHFIVENTRDAITHYKYAIANTKSTNQKDESEKGLGECLKDTLRWTATQPLQLRKGLNEELISSLPPDFSGRAEAYKDQALFWLSLAESQIEAKDYIQSLEYVNECKRCLQAASSPSTDGTGNLATSIQLLVEQADNVVLRNTAMQDVDSAEALLSEMEEDEEDKAYDAIDHLHSALRVIKGKKLEIEGQVTCRIAQVYEKNLNHTDRATKWYRKAAELSRELPLSEYTGKAWFKKCQTYMAQFQTEAQAVDVKEEAGDPEIQQDLKRLKAHQGDKTAQFLNFVYQNWPPKQETAKLDTTLSEKDMLRRARKHYHPDHYMNESARMQVLCGEISLLIDSKLRHS